VDVGIPPRQLDFQLSDSMSRWFYDGNATATLFIVMLSASFPPGEQFFVRSVNQFRAVVTDSTLRAQVAGFTGQEVIHSREHDRLNAAIAARRIDARMPERAVAAAIWLIDRLPARFRLACTAQAEHLTALLAEEILAGESFRARMDPELVEMWLWHALEELEHKSVSYDVYDVVGNRRLERLLAEPVLLVTVGVAALGGWAYLLASTGTWRRPSDLRRGAGLLFGSDGLVGCIWSKLKQFREPEFHPARHDTTALERHWREVLFGERGSLNDQLRRRPA
jgi:predicted metal-dependent hydrolase